MTSSRQGLGHAWSAPRCSHKLTKSKGRIVLQSLRTRVSFFSLRSFFGGKRHARAPSGNTVSRRSGPCLGNPRLTSCARAGPRSRQTQSRDEGEQKNRVTWKRAISRSIDHSKAMPGAFFWAVPRQTRNSTRRARVLPRHESATQGTLHQRSPRRRNGFAFFAVRLHWNLSNGACLECGDAWVAAPCERAARGVQCFFVLVLTARFHRERTTLPSRARRRTKTRVRPVLASRHASFFFRFCWHAAPWHCGGLGRT
jgi:hypothetical protein